MSTTIPSREISIEDKKKFRNQVLEQCAQKYKLIQSPEGLSVLDLSPEELGLKDWQTPIPNAEYTRWIAWTVPANKIVAIYKVLQLSLKPTVTALKIWEGPQINTLGIHQLEICYGGLPIIQTLARSLMSEDAKEVLSRLSGIKANFATETSPELGAPMEAYFNKPYIFGPNEQFEIHTKSRKKGSDYLVLGGYVIEPAGLSVS